jgi:TatD DNase family protein
MLVDSHCHLDLPELAGNLPQALGLMQQNDVGCALCIGVNLEDFPRVLALAQAHPQLYASVGVHPETGDAREPSVGDLVALAQHPKVLAIGETGLDYYWQKDAPEWQRERFRTHIRAAIEIGKPLVVHNRDATADTLRLLAEEDAARAGGVLHCFTESWEVAERALALGFYISLSGIVTFKNARLVHEVARRVPLDRLLIETDSPYLAPVPYRGKINQPGYVRYVAEEIARLRDLPFSEVAQATTENFFRLFPTAYLAHSGTSQ